MKFLIFRGDFHAFGFLSCSLAFGVRHPELRSTLVTRVSRGCCGNLGSAGFHPHEASGFIARPPLGLVTCVRLLEGALTPPVVLVLLLPEPELRRLCLLKSSQNSTSSLRKNSSLLVGLCLVRFSHRLSHKDQGSLALQELEPFIHKAEASISEQLLGKGGYFHSCQTPESVPVLSQGARLALML